MSAGWDERVASLTRDIASHAQSKQLDAALAAFTTIEAEGRTPTKYTHAAILNAHVNSGDLAGAARALERMEAAGHAPNIIVYTTMLKGHCAVGDLDAARELLESMGRCKPPVRPDARTLNTFMRGCVRVGDVGAAKWAFGKLDEWKLSPGAAAVVAFGRLLSQGLRLGELRKALKAHEERASAPIPHRPTRTANRCAFWDKGKCDRGLNCNFFHDPSVRQSDAHQLDAANRDIELELSVHLAHAAALLGRPVACAKALKRADALLLQAEASEGADGAGGGGGSGWGAAAATGKGGPSWEGEGGEGGGDFVMDENRYGTGLHAGFRRAELRRECERISAYLTTRVAGASAAEGGGNADKQKKKKAKKKEAKEAKGGGLPRLDPYLTRCLVFATRLQPSDGSAATADAGALDAGGGGGGGASARKVLAKRLLRALKTTAGLGPASKLGLCSKAHVKRRLRKAIARDGRLRWRKVFRPPSEEEEGGGVAPKADEAASASASASGSLPVKLEIASGTGDWVVAQARCDVGKASWACVELRHDRVYHTLSLMALRTR